jgi:hypothetical protein
MKTPDELVADFLARMMASPERFVGISTPRELHPGVTFPVHVAVNFDWQFWDGQAWVTTWQEAEHFDGLATCLSVVSELWSIGQKCSPCQVSAK